VAKFVVAGGIMAFVLGALQANNELGAGAKLFWVVVATVVALVLTRPVRSFKTIVPGLDPNKSYLRTALSGAATYFGARFGAEEGTEAGLRGSFDRSATDQPAAALMSSAPDTRESLEALPLPAWASTPSPAPVWTQSPATAGPATGTPTAAAALPPPRTSANTGDWTRGQTWPGLVSGAPARPELSAAPLRLEAVPDPASSGAARVIPDADTRPVSVRPVPVGLEVVGTDTVVDSLTVSGGGPTPDSGPVDPTVTHRPRATAAAADGGSDVVYPSGIIVAAEEHPLYQRAGGQGSEASEVYLTLPETELAEDGTEHAMVPYYSRTGTAHGPA